MLKATPERGLRMRIVTYYISDLFKAERVDKKFFRFQNSVFNNVRIYGINLGWSNYRTQKTIIKGKDLNYCL